MFARVQVRRLSSNEFRYDRQILFSFLALASETSYHARLCLSLLLQGALLFTEYAVARGILKL